MTTFIILLIGFSLIGLVLKIAKGIIKIVLIIVLLIMIAGGSAVTHKSEPLPQSTEL